MSASAQSSSITGAALARRLPAAVLLAAAVLLGFVLPAEYDVDPLGVGAAIGIKGMSGYAAQALTPAQGALRRDEKRFYLEPFQSVEYKYTLEAEGFIVYEWDAGEAVVYDFHAEQVGRPPEDSVSFAVGREARHAATYVAPFAGVHGWFWENRGEQPVEVVLQAQGTFSAGTIYDRTGARKIEF